MYIFMLEYSKSGKVLLILFTSNHNTVMSCASTVSPHKYHPSRLKLNHTILVDCFYLTSI